jgi:preprotein translocase SecE subunit
MVFDIYKRGQGKNTRLCSGFAVALMVGLGCLRLYDKLEAASWWGLSTKANMWVATMVPAGLFVGLALLIFWLVNKASVADFLIAAEGEMKKVSWSSREEITVSTIIVIIVLVTMAILLGTTDIGFKLFFDWLI